MVLTPKCTNAKFYLPFHINGKLFPGH